jgi:hypothetical protein
MKLDETENLLRFAAAFDARTVNEESIAAWQWILSEEEFSEAMDAATEHYRTESRPLMPADVCRRTKRADPDAVPTSKDPGWTDYWRRMDESQ